MSARPWYAWFPSDFDSKTRSLSRVEVAVYRDILDASWRGSFIGMAPGRIPNEPKLIADVIHRRGDRKRQVLAAVQQVLDLFWPENTEGYRENRRMLREYEKACFKAERQSLGAQLANSKRAVTAQLAGSKRDAIDGEPAHSKRAVRARASQPQPQPQPHIKERNVKERKNWRILPEGEVLNDERRQYAINKGIKEELIPLLWEQFAEHEHRTPKSDPDRSWQGWVRNHNVFRAIDAEADVFDPADPKPTDDDRHDTL